MSTTRTTIRTIERGVRVASNSKSQSSKERQGSRAASRNASPSCDLHVKQQLHAFIDHSNLEKNELSKLNERFSCYVDKVKALECENTKLAAEIKDAQSHWGEDTRQIRECYEQNLFELRTRIDDVANLKTIADVRNKRSSYENCEYQRRLADTVKLNENEKGKIKNLERELAQAKESNELLKKSIADELCDIEKYRLNRDETWSQLVDLLDKLDDELYRRISVEYNNQTLREHIEFVKAVNERELAEMSQLPEALPFNDQVEFYKDQLKRVINNIRKDYENLHLEQTRELEEWMRLKSEELAIKANEKDALHEIEMGIQLENIESLRNTHDANNKEIDELKRQHELMTKQLEAIEKHVEGERGALNETLNLQNCEIEKLGDDLNNLLNDYNHINANKANLEYEMQVYKRLLDSQLERLNCPEPVPAITHSKVVQVTTEIKNQTSVSSNAFGGKVQNKKEKKGTIGICDSSPDGKFIIIENTGNNTQIDLSGWKIQRIVDGNTDITYQIPAGFVIPSNKEITIWAKTYSQQKNPCDLVAEFENWGIGINSVSKLLSSNGEEKSTFHQQITFSSRY